MHSKLTIKDFKEKYRENEYCLKELKDLRWPSGITCCKCKALSKHYKVKGRMSYVCEFCGHQVYPLKDTIFEKSTTPLKVWFYAIYLFVQTRGEITGKDLQRELRITYKTSWRMLNRIKSLVES